MSEVESAAPDGSPGLKVMVTEMPEKPAKSLLRDPNRLLSLAAFVFSVTTGVFATYHTWRSSTETTIENVSKLTDQYYEGQAKLAQLNQSQTGYINLLRTTLRSTALRASAQASLVKKDIDEGTWLALAQINDNENNLAASETAWKAAADATHDISVYSFGMRGLAANRMRQGDRAGADEAFTAVIKASLADKFKGTPNGYLPEYRNIEAAATEAFWLSSVRAPDCAFVSDHFDKSLKYIAEAHKTALPTDLGYVSELIGTRVILNYMRKARTNCAPSSQELLAADDCFGIGEVVDNAQYGFAGYRGNPEKPGQSDSGVWSLYYLADVENCVVTSFSDFHCTWPERDESNTAARATAIADKLMACKNFAGMKRTVTTRESTSRTLQVTHLSSENRVTVRVNRSHWKAEDGSPRDWGVSLEIRRP